MEQVIAAGIITGVLQILWIILAVKSKHMQTLQGEKSSAVSGVGRWIARLPFLEDRSSAAVKSMLRSLHQTEDGRAVCERYYAEKYAKAYILLLSAGYLSVAWGFSNLQGSILQDGYTLWRGGYESDGEQVGLIVTDEETGLSTLYDHELLGRTYDATTLTAMAKKMEAALPTLILADNESTQAVRTGLLLTDTYPDHPFAVDWESSDYSLVDSDGTVYNDGLENPARVTLTAVLSYRDFEKECTISLNILPRVYSLQEQERMAVEQELARADRTQQVSDRMILPKILLGHQVSYRVEEGSNPLLLIPAGALVGILIFFLSDRDLETKLMKERKEMESAYPAFVSKFVLLYGAGMSVRNTLARISEGDIQEGLRLQLQILLRDLSNGILESAALEQFGHRIGSPLYIKFSSLLIENQKRGSTDLKKILSEEAGQAFDLRRNLAKKKGEEAGTKLLFPMIMMLGVVMAVIIMPAFLSF